MKQASHNQNFARLYAGMAVRPSELDEVIESIKLNGLISNERSLWIENMPDPKQIRLKRDHLLDNPDAIRGFIDSLPDRPLVHAFGDTYGATYYATKGHTNKDKTASILIEFEVPMDSLCVDGRLFLYQAFQFWDSAGDKSFLDVGMKLAACFGSQIFQYFQVASGCKEQIARVGICELACNDLEIVEAHLNNDIQIIGRGSHQFCSAFKLQLPIPESAIIRIAPCPEMPPPADTFLTLSDIR